MIRIVFPFAIACIRVLKNKYAFSDLEDNELTATDILILPGWFISEGMSYLQEQSLITKIITHAKLGGKGIEFA